MPFKIFESARASSPPDQDLSVDDAETATKQARSQQLALRLNGGRHIALAPSKRMDKFSPQDVSQHIIHLSGQIEALHRQLEEHSADRIALLLREMIHERERELDRFLAQESRWDDRLGAIEEAISERDAFRRRETTLVEERDEARREAAAATARSAAALETAAAARRTAEAVQRAADKAQAEQLRLRAEREIDERKWASERRHLATQRERGWLGRILRG